MGYLLFDDMVEDARLIIRGAKAINNLAKSERVKQGVKQMQNMGKDIQGKISESDALKDIRGKISDSDTLRDIQEKVGESEALRNIQSGIGKTVEESTILSSLGVNLGGRLSGSKMRRRSICPKCGSKAREGASFCSRCGTSLVES